MREIALIVGAGYGLSASLAKLLFCKGFQIILAARNTQKLEAIARKTNARLCQCDASNSKEVGLLFDKIREWNQIPTLVIYNPSQRFKGRIENLNLELAKKAIETTSLGGLYVSHYAAKEMLQLGRGSIFFTGASASVKGFAESSVFALGKFGLRGLAQSLARELHPQNIHIAHFVIDGQILNVDKDSSFHESKDQMLHPDAIAETYLQFHMQSKSSWSWEIELRPWLEKF
jgi:short-subunit dehydrogenase